jgi:hypothetical protein
MEEIIKKVCDLQEVAERITVVKIIDNSEIKE